MIFNAARLFSLKHYPINELDIGILTEQLVTHFRWSDDLVNQCNMECPSFSTCINKNLHQANGTNFCMQSGYEAISLTTLRSLIIVDHNFFLEFFYIKKIF